MKTLSHERLDELTRLLLTLEQDYDHGLREFQEALHYAIFYMSITKSTEIIQEDKLTCLLYLRDLTNRFKKMEELMSSE